MKLHSILLLTLIATGSISVANAFASSHDISMPTNSSVFWNDHRVSITSANTDGTSDGTFLTQRGIDGIVYRIGGDPSFGSGFEVMRIDVTGTVKFGGGKTLSWENNQVSIGRTDSAGSVNSGGFLNMRGAEGIVYRIGGADIPGTGFEVLRIDDAGVIRLAIGKSFTWVNHQVGISRTDTTGGVNSGGFMTFRGQEGYIFKVGGADVAGDGFEIARIQGANIGIGTSSPAEKLDVNGNIKLSGFARSITSDGDICIGTCS
jgi:hypothetical protein